MTRKKFAGFGKIATMTEEGKRVQRLEVDCLGLRLMAGEMGWLITLMELER